MQVWRFLALLLLALPTAAQIVAPSRSDADLIVEALKGGPAYISANAAILAWPASPGSSYRVLRPGTNGWACLPTSAQHMPVCADAVFLKFFQDAVAQRPVHVESVGIAYMYEGDMVAPHGSGPGHTYHVGPHIMLVVPDGRGLSNYTLDGSTGEAYINRVPGTETPYLVIPLHETPIPGAR